MLKPQSAFSLIEILVVLCILSIMGAIAVPSFSYFKNTHQANTKISQLANAIRTAKLNAITLGKKTVICPLNREFKCSPNWGSELTVFTDLNQNRQFDQNENSRKFPYKVEVPEKILFNGSQNMIRFHSSGFPQGTFGSFIYCPYPIKKDFIRSLVVNMQGQIKTLKLDKTQKQRLKQLCEESST